MATPETPFPETPLTDLDRFVDLMTSFGVSPEILERPGRLPQPGLGPFAPDRPGQSPTTEVVFAPGDTNGIGGYTYSRAAFTFDENGNFESVAVYED